jgi:hypothetical protein
MKTNLLKTFAIALTIGALATAAQAGPRDDIIAKFQAQAGAPANPANGEKMFFNNYGTGKPDTPGCTSCHGEDPRQGGQTRAGKAIDPIAVSRTPDRFTDPEKVDKWFLRNCQGVIGRECTAQEKVDFLTFMTNQ